MTRLDQIKNDTHFNAAQIAVTELWDLRRLIGEPSEIVDNLSFVKFDVGAKITMLATTVRLSPLQTEDEEGLLRWSDKALKTIGAANA